MVQFIKHLFAWGAHEGDSCCAAVGWAQSMAMGSGIPLRKEWEPGAGQRTGRFSVGWLCVNWPNMHHLNSTSNSGVQ